MKKLLVITSPVMAGNEKKCNCDWDCSGKCYWGRFCKRLMNIFSAVGRLIWTIGDFCGCLFVLCWILHTYILLGTLDLEGTVAMIIVFFVTGNILLIPIWHFSEFPYFKERHFPWQSLLELWGLVGNKGCLCASCCLEKENTQKYSLKTGNPCCTARMIWPLIEAVLGAFFFIIFLGMAFFGSVWCGKVMDIFLLFFLIFIPLIRYVLILLGYVVHFYKSLGKGQRAKFREIYRKALHEHTMYDGKTIRCVHEIESPVSGLLQQSPELYSEDDKKSIWTENLPKPTGNEKTVDSDTLAYVPDP